MIWLHTYGIGKFGKEIRLTVHETKESAEAAQKVLGGEFKAYRDAEDSVECWQIEHMRNVLESELSEIIDNMMCQGPGGPWEELGSPEWDYAKADIMDKISEIIDEVYE